MKATELMINDLVRVDGVVRIAAIRTGAVYDYMNKEYSIGCINPIPLTAEILEKNGWKEYPQIYSNQKTINFDIYRFEDEVGVKIQGYCMVLKYVHELQHALRLCELNELADNFQIV